MIKKIFFTSSLLIIFFINTNFVLAEEYENKIVYKNKNSLELKTVEVNNQENIQDKINELKQDENIEIAEPNYIRYILKQPNDYYFSDQWHLSQSNDADIDAGKAWDRETGKASTVIAILDTGVDIDHEDLIDNIWENKNEVADNGIDDDNNGYIDDVNGWDFINNNNDVNPDPNGIGGDDGVTHGTHVAGIVAARGNNSVGVAGVCWKCSIMPIQVMNDEGLGTISAIYDGIMYAIDNGADIINLSFGSYSYSATEKIAIDAAQSAGIVIVAAAGNNNYNLNKTPIYPACDKGVIGVGATTKKDKRSSFSNYGKDCVDVSAPGNLILSTWYIDSKYNFNDEYGYLSGTSMAAPIISGIAGLLKSYRPSLSKTKISNYIINNADDKKLGAKMGTGRVNADTTLKKVESTYSKKPKKPKKITAYTGKKKGHKIKVNTSTSEKTPFFTWSKAKTSRGKITGYYVYWGRRKISNPVRKGRFQKKRNYAVKKKKKIKRDEQTVYYLKIKSKNSLNKKSKKSKIFQYIYQPV